MYRNIWVNDQRKNLICVDSYEEGIPKGRFYDGDYSCIPFHSLSHLLISMDRMLDEKQVPQSFTKHRSFSSRVPMWEQMSTGEVQRGKEATFEIRVLFRQNSSWQGSLHWMEKNIEQSFRSVLELINLLDSALQEWKIKNPKNFKKFFWKK